MATSKITRVLPREKKDAVVAGDIISFQLPDGIVDLSSVNLWMNATISNATANNMALPRDVETLIEHLWITIDGEEVQRTIHYNQLFRMLWDIEQTHDDQRKRIFLSWSGYANSALNQAAFNVTNSLICMSKWYGLLGSNNVIDTRLTGPVVVNMQFAPNNVLMATVTSATYSLSDVAMTLSLLADDTPIPRAIAFDNFRAIMQFNPTYNQVTQFVIACRKLKFLTATFLPPAYRSTAISSSTNPIGTSLYFLHGTTSSATSLPTFAFTFAIDETPLLDAPLSHLAGLETMKWIFPNGSTMYNNFTIMGGITNAGTTFANFLKAVYACGIPVKERPDDARPMRVLKFATLCNDTSSTTNIANNSLFVACHESSLVYDPSANKYRFLL